MKYKVTFEVEYEVNCDGIKNLCDVVKKHTANGESLPYAITSTQFDGYNMKFKKVVKGIIIK